MSIRIWHQSFTVLEDLPAYAERLQQHARRIVRPDTQVVLHGQAKGTYPADYPGDDIGFSYLFWVHGNQWVARAIDAERQGFDVYMQSTLPNPLIREIRTLVDIPVVGFGESSYHLACMLGQRFGVLLFIDRLIPMYRDQIRRQYELEARCAGVEHVGFTFRDVLQGFSDPAPLIKRFEEAARRMIRAGADVIIPGEVPLNLLLASNGVNRVDDVPVLDGFAATLKMAETMVELRRLTGLKQSRHGWFNAAPKRERVEQVMQFYGLDRLLDPGKG